MYIKFGYWFLVWHLTISDQNQSLACFFKHALTTLTAMQCKILSLLPCHTNHPWDQHVCIWHLVSYKGWFNNYVMQWWHPLVWEKIMVGLCLCWDRGGWWGKRLCIMVFWTMLLRMPLQPRGNIPIAANITFLEDSLGHYNKTSNISISRFLIKV